MAAANHLLSTAALVAGTAAVSCTLTGLVAAYLLPRYYQQQQQQQQLEPADSAPAASEAAAHSRACCSTPEPTLPGVADPHQQQQQRRETDMALFSPVNPQKRPDPYDVRPRSTYLSWDDYFMAVAFLSAERSKDPNKQVGACIVNDEQIILSIGYNGFPRGCADNQLPWAKRAVSGSILDTKYPYVVHAEANALLNKNQAHVTGARIYVTLFPCNECAKLLIQAGIREVVYHEAKLEPTGKRPGTMEQAAAAEAAADALEEAEWSSSRQGCGHSGSSSSSACGHDAASIADQTQLQKQQCSDAQGNRGTKSSKRQEKQQAFSVGATSDLDASYVASQRLLTMAGVKLRQHTLQHSIHLGQHGSCSR